MYIMNIDLGDIEEQTGDNYDDTVDGAAVDGAALDDAGVDGDDFDDDISIESLDDLESDKDNDSLQSEDSDKNKVINTENTKNISYYLSDDESDDDENDDEYLYKLDQDIKTNYINDVHPETSIQNYEEVKKLSLVVRNVYGIVVDPLHKTNPIMTKYEYSRILGQRAKQIESGATPFVKVDNNILDSYVIAENELKEKKIPFIIRRPIPNGGFEYWNVNDLEILF